MTPDEWEQIQSLYYAAVEREPDERAAFLAARCRDPLVRGEVEALLTEHERAGAFLNAPALDVAAEAAADTERGSTSKSETPDSLRRSSRA